MAEIINLRQARKQKRRADKTAQAEQNRAKFGRDKGQKAENKRARDRAEQDLDGKKLD
ncbi:MAG: DUF4169 family protein [Pseudomonadota bacterium]